MSRKLNAYPSIMEELAIDPDRLELEWLRQPVLFSKYGTMLAEAEKRMNELQSRYKVIRAELTKDIFVNPDEFGLDRATEKRIDAVVDSHPRYVNAYAEYLEAQREYSILNAIVSSIHQRRAALENLVTLYRAEYFASGTTVPRELPDQRVLLREYRTESAFERMAKRKNRRPEKKEERTRPKIKTRRRRADS